MEQLKGSLGPLETCRALHNPLQIMQRTAQPVTQDMEYYLVRSTFYNNNVSCRAC